MTKRKSPSVTTVKGMVNKTRTGFTETLSTERIAATKMAYPNPVRCTPDKRFTVITTAIALRRSLVRKFIIA